MSQWPKHLEVVVDDEHETITLIDPHGEIAEAVYPDGGNDAALLTEMVRRFNWHEALVEMLERAMTERVDNDLRDEIVALLRSANP